MTGRISAEHPVLIDKHQVAGMTSLSVRTIERLVSTGRFPPPMRLGRRRLWHRQKLDAWLADGAISAARNGARDFFESRKESP